MARQDKYYSENRGPDLRKKNGEANHWVVNDMWSMHHEIARRIVLGQKNVEIARDLNCSAQLVSNVKNSPVVQEQITLLNGARNAETVDLAREIALVAPDAMKLITDIIRGENDGVNATLGLRAKEANGMLARAGFGVPQRIQSESVNVHLTSQDIQEIKRRAVGNSDVLMDAKNITNEIGVTENG